jgi:hypothetical protein
MTGVSSYPKIYAMGHRELKELFNGPVVVEEKVDGSQLSWTKDPTTGELRARSKGVGLQMGAPEKLFGLAVQTIQCLGPSLTPGWVYRGEYLSKPGHNSLAYDRVPKQHIMLFDVELGEGSQRFLDPDGKKAEAERLGLECVPCFHNGVLEGGITALQNMLDRVSVLGGAKIEGLVVKNYDQLGHDKKILLGKFVSESFKEIHTGKWKESNPSGTDIIATIGAMLRTPARREKAVQHLRDSGKLDESLRDIGPLINEVRGDTLAEAKDEIVKALLKWAMPKVEREIVRGVPEWYKDRLARSQAGLDQQHGIVVCDQPQPAPTECVLQEGYPIA